MATTSSLAGRDAELERMRQLTAAASLGESGCVALFGPPGQGKTALLDQLCAETRAAGELQIVHTIATEGESAIPFGALDGLLRPLLGELDALPPTQRQALEAALALGETPNVSTSPLAIGAGTLSLLGAAADQQPLLCVIDDFHWADAESLMAILFAARRLSTEPIAMVLSMRGEDRPAVEIRGIETLALRPLDDGAAAIMLDELGAARAAPETRQAIIAAGAGNPLVLEELVRRLTKPELEGRERPLGPPRPHRGARDLLAERISALSVAAREALLVVAASDVGSVGQIGPALELLGTEARALEEAEGAGLVELRAGALEMRHPLVRSVVYHDAEPEARRRAHAAVAEALGKEDPRALWHRAAAAADSDEDLASQLDAEATRSALRGGYLASGRTRLRAADLTPEPTARVERLLESANDFEVAGDFEEAGRILDRAAVLNEDPVTALRIEGVAASLELRSGRPVEARARLLTCAHGLIRARPLSAARYFLQAAFASMAINDAEGWTEHARAALDVVPGDAPATAEVARAMLGAGLIALLDESAAEPYVQRVERGLRARPPDEPVGGAIEVFALLARSLIWAGRFEIAGRMLDRLEDDARQLGNGAGLPAVLNMRVILEGQRGRWAVAAAAADEELELAREVGDGIFEPSALMLGAWVAALRGRSDDCRALATQVLDGPLGSNPAVGIWAHYALGLLALGCGEIARAVEHLTQLEGASGFPEPGSRLWQPDLIEALIRAGDLDRAARLLDAWEAEGAASGRALAQATAARCRGLIAAGGDFEAPFAVALEHHTRLPMPFELARTQLCLGECRRRAKQRALARGPLRDALEAFQELGAEAYAARARSELRATGGMVPSRAASELDELTPHEVQVATMVAEGKTNREVAAALFLAPKTIEHHLSTIFRKLGVKRRTELAKLFAGDRTRPPAD